MFTIRVTSRDGVELQVDVQARNEAQAIRAAEALRSFAARHGSNDLLNSYDYRYAVPFQRRVA